MKFFIPPKLNRGFNIGPYNMIDAFLLIPLTMLSVYFSLKFETAIPLFPLAVLIVIRVKTDDGRTVGKKAWQRIKFIVNLSEYELRGCFDENSQND